MCLLLELYYYYWLFFILISTKYQLPFGMQESFLNSQIKTQKCFVMLKVIFSNVNETAALTIGNIYLLFQQFGTGARRLSQPAASRKVPSFTHNPQCAQGKSPKIPSSSS